MCGFFSSSHEILSQLLCIYIPFLFHKGWLVVMVPIPFDLVLIEYTYCCFPSLSCLVSYSRFCSSGKLNGFIDSNSLLWRMWIFSVSFCATCISLGCRWYSRQVRRNWWPIWCKSWSQLKIGLGLEDVSFADSCDHVAVSVWKARE